MKTMQPMALRMPHVFQEPRSFSHDNMRTQSRNTVRSPPSSHRQRYHQDLQPASPNELNLPIMGSKHDSGSDYFHQQPSVRAPSRHSNNPSISTIASPGPSVETHTWCMASLPYEIDLDVFPRHTLDRTLTLSTIDKVTSKLATSSATPPPSSSSSSSKSRNSKPIPTLVEEHRSKNFAKVVFSIAPTPSLPGDHIPLPLSTLKVLLGPEGLLGFFARVDRYCETHFRIRDISARGGGRYVAVGRLRKGTFRGSGCVTSPTSSSMLNSNGENGYFGHSNATTVINTDGNGNGDGRQSQQGSRGKNGGGVGTGGGIFGGASKADIKRAFASNDADATTLDGERNSNAEFEAFKRRIQGMNMRV